jgi:hypothetical protein
MNAVSDRFGKMCDASGGNDLAQDGLCDEICCATSIGADNGCACAERLVHDDAPSVETTGKHKQIASIKHCRNLLIRKRASPYNAIRKSPSVSLFPECRFQGPHAGNFQPPREVRERSERLEQKVNSLPANELADEGDGEGARVCFLRIGR